MILTIILFLNLPWLEIPLFGIFFFMWYLIWRWWKIFLNNVRFVVFCLGKAFLVFLHVFRRGLVSLGYAGLGTGLRVWIVVWVSCVTAIMVVSGMWEFFEWVWTLKRFFVYASLKTVNCDLFGCLEDHFLYLRTIYLMIIYC